MITKLLTSAIYRPIATWLLTLAVILAGVLAFFKLPVAPLPQVELPTIMVQASFPGANPETMASTVAMPLEQSLGRIAGVTEMTSSSSLGSTRITLQFDLSKNINEAAREVQAAINAARPQLPSGMPNNPTYRKLNPADAPIMVLALNSQKYTRAQLYDVASTMLVQKISRIDGVGQVTLAGGASPAVRIELNPSTLNSYGISLEQVRTALNNTNTNRPKGFLESDKNRWVIYANDQAKTASEYLNLVIANKNGNLVKLGDVARVIDSIQDIRNVGYANGKTAIILLVSLQAQANMLATIERIQEKLPLFQSVLPPNMQLDVMQERSSTIRGALHEAERSLLIAVFLVVLVVFAFLHDWRVTLIPAITVPVSICLTLSVMYLLGYSLNNLSLMALTVATGFVVDDAIVVVENVMRYREKGMGKWRATLRALREVRFTVISISISLVAVFIPIIFMDGIVGRFLREFAVSLSVSILASMIVALTTTPMLCAQWLKEKAILNPDHADEKKQTQQIFVLEKIWRSVSARVFAFYKISLQWSLKHPIVMVSVLLVTIGLNFYLYATVPKGFVPQQDTGRFMGNLRADQSASFTLMQSKLFEVMQIIRDDPAVDTVVGSASGAQGNRANLFVSLKPLKERQESSDQVLARLRPKLNNLTGARVFLQLMQDLRTGGRQADGQYQYTLQSDSLAELRTWIPRLQREMEALPQITDVSTDQDDRAQQITLNVNRDALAQYGLTMRQVDTVLSNTLSQRQVAVIYNDLDQYRVVMESDPNLFTGEKMLEQIYIQNSQGQAIKLSNVAKIERTFAPLRVNHQGLFAAGTLSFNLNEGYALSDANQAISQAMKKLDMPNNIQGGFQGTAKTFQSSQSNQLILIIAAILTLYIVLGVLYESYIHPFTILSTLPSAGIGALLALMMFGSELDIIALIGIILLIGIVKKNAIILIDFAITLQIKQNMSARSAIYEAALIRVRPIMMTTVAAVFGALPLALGTGDGAELRRPLGISVVGGLLISQVLTLYTTPVVFVLMDKINQWVKRIGARFSRQLSPKKIQHEVAS